MVKKCVCACAVTPHVILGLNVCLAKKSYLFRVRAFAARFLLSLPFSCWCSITVLAAVTQTARGNLLRKSANFKES